MKTSVVPSPVVKRLLKELGEKIKMARLRRSISIELLGKRAGISFNTVVAIEKGSPGVSIGAIANVLHALSLTEDISLLAKDDVLGRKLQDLKLVSKKRAPKNDKK